MHYYDNMVAIFPVLGSSDVESDPPGVAMVHYTSVQLAYLRTGLPHVYVENM